MTIEELAKTKCIKGWRRPEAMRADINASGEYWWWNGDLDSAPVAVTVFVGLTGGPYLFAPMGQLGWNRAQDLNDMGGWWKRIPEAKIPDELFEFEKRARH